MSIHPARQEHAHEGVSPKYRTPHRITHMGDDEEFVLGKSAITPLESTRVRSMKNETERHVSRDLNSTCSLFPFTSSVDGSNFLCCRSISTSTS
jgi:hypothetical protein